MSLTIISTGVLIPEHKPFLCQAGQVPDHLVCVFLHSKCHGSRLAVDLDKSRLQAWQSKIVQQDHLGKFPNWGVLQRCDGYIRTGHMLCHNFTLPNTSN